MTNKTNKVQIGNRNLKAGDRVAQSHSLQYFTELGNGFPWKVVQTWDCGDMAKLEWVGPDGKESGGYANAVLTNYLVKEFKQFLTSGASFAIVYMWLGEKPLNKKEKS